jgi:hypothetical protein
MSCFLRQLHAPTRGAPSAGVRAGSRAHGAARPARPRRAGCGSGYDASGGSTSGGTASSRARAHGRRNGKSRHRAGGRHGGQAKLAPVVTEAARQAGTVMPRKRSLATLPHPASGETTPFSRPVPDAVSARRPAAWKGTFHQLLVSRPAHSRGQPPCPPPPPRPPARACWPICCRRPHDARVQVKGGPGAAERVTSFRHPRTSASRTGC